jgi:hypothetical protein
MPPITAIIKITETRVDKLLLNFNLRSKKLPTGNNKMAIKKEKSRGANKEWPKMAMYVKLIKQKRTRASLGRNDNLSFI